MVAGCVQVAWALFFSVNNIKSMVSPVSSHPNGPMAQEARIPRSPMQRGRPRVSVRGVSLHHDLQRSHCEPAARGRRGNGRLCGPELHSTTPVRTWLGVATTVGVLTWYDQTVNGNHAVQMFSSYDERVCFFHADLNHCRGIAKYAKYACKGLAFGCPGYFVSSV